MKLSGRIGRIKPSATLSINAKANGAQTKRRQHNQFRHWGARISILLENIRNAAMESIRSGQTRYTAVGGIDELKDAVCSYHQSRLRPLLWAGKRSGILRRKTCAL